MALMTVEDGLLEFLLQWATKANVEEYEIGLYKNDWTPIVGNTISDVLPADFGGYSGLQSLDSWDTGGITFSSPRAIVTHPYKTWTADGSTTNTIYGYYVVTSGGVLLWAQRRSTGGISIGVVPGQTYSVIPRYTFRPEP